MDVVKVRKIGDAMVVTLPADVIEKFGLRDGDALAFGLEPDGIMLRPERGTLDRQRDLARRIMDENGEALRLLAR